MARIRTIKPEFFTSEDITSLTPLARLFYVSLWCEADREGLLSWRKGTLKQRYLPADSVSIELLADELESAGLIVIYEVEGKEYAEIPSFKSHQVINNRESESIIPSRVKVASQRVQAEGREGRKGREGKGKEGIERATRLTHDFQMPEEWIIFCQTERPDLIPEKTFERFRDYWVAKAGKDGAKLDWLATWRNWVRDQRPTSVQRQGAKSFAERDREAGIARWEEQTGRIHPDRQKHQLGQVIDVTPPFLEIEQ
jgi:hypothetical protein